MLTPQDCSGSKIYMKKFRLLRLNSCCERGVTMSGALLFLNDRNRNGRLRNRAFDSAQYRGGTQRKHKSEKRRRENDRICCGAQTDDKMRYSERNPKFVFVAVDNAVYI